jgi:serine phosphatase RsbU (regulator of sigma subunit)
VGTLCLVDTTPHEFGPEQRRLLDEMGQWVERELEDTADLDRAAEVQQGLLPQDQPGRPDYEVAGICLPAKSVGGDFYAWHGDGSGDGDGADAGAGAVPSTVIELTLADVMGKGAAGAILAAAVRAAFQSRTGLDVVGAVEAVNAQLADDLGGIGSFATLFHATIDTASGRIDYADAGHGLSVIVRRDGTAERLEATGLPIGIVAHGESTRGSAALEPGDRLVTFTDGVLDLFDGTLASLDQVAAIVRAAPSPHDAIARFAELTAAAPTSDDVTVVVLARRP